AEKKKDWNNAWIVMKTGAETWMRSIITDVVKIAATLPKAIGTAIGASAQGLSTGLRVLTTFLSYGLASGINNTIVKGVNSALKWMGLSTRMPEIKISGSGGSTGFSGRSGSGGTQKAYAKGTKHKKHTG